MHKIFHRTGKVYVKTPDTNEIEVTNANFSTHEGNAIWIKGDDLIIDNAVENQLYDIPAGFEVKVFGVCETCQKQGLRNCGYFDECSGAKIYAEISHQSSLQSLSRYRKKPVEIEAVVFKWGMEDGVARYNEVIPRDAAKYVHSTVFKESEHFPGYLSQYDNQLISRGFEVGSWRPYLKTLESGDVPTHFISEGDYIITGVKGERYACKPDIFAMTYSKLESQPQPEESQDALWGQASKILLENILNWGHEPNSVSITFDFSELQSKFIIQRKP